jgi:hypothetical protein
LLQFFQLLLIFLNFLKVVESPCIIYFSLDLLDHFRIHKLCQINYLSLLSVSWASKDCCEGRSYLLDPKLKGFSLLPCIPLIGVSLLGKCSLLIKPGFWRCVGLNGSPPLIKFVRVGLTIMALLTTVAVLYRRDWDLVLDVAQHLHVDHVSALGVAAGRPSLAF